MAQHKVATAQEIPTGTIKCVQVEDLHIAIYNKDGEFFATDSVCPHAGGPLHEGQLEGDEITCPLHGWKFDIKEGSCKTIPSMKLQTFPVIKKDDDLYIEIQNE